MRFNNADEHLIDVVSLRYPRCLGDEPVDLSPSETWIAHLFRNARWIRLVR